MVRQDSRKYLNLYTFDNRDNGLKVPRSLYAPVCPKGLTGVFVGFQVRCVHYHDLQYFRQGRALQ